MVQSGVQALLTNPQRTRFYGIDSPTITPLSEMKIKNCYSVPH